MTPDFTYQADMGFTRHELLKGLHTAVEPYTVKLIADSQAEISQQGRSVRLTMGAEGFRAIASMRIPLLPVTMDFYNFSEDQFDSFMSRFRRYLHKGGG